MCNVYTIVAYTIYTERKEPSGIPGARGIQVHHIDRHTHKTAYETMRSVESAETRASIAHARYDVNQLYVWIKV